MLQNFVEHKRHTYSPISPSARQFSTFWDSESSAAAHCYNSSLANRIARSWLSTKFSDVIFSKANI